MKRSTMAWASQIGCLFCMWSVACNNQKLADGNTGTKPIPMDSTNADLARSQKAQGVSPSPSQGVIGNPAAQPTAAQYKGQCADAGSDFRQKGPHPVKTSAEVEGYSLYYPMDMNANFKYPILSWGNGTGVSGGLTDLNYGTFFNHLASHGFVVIASHSAMTGTGAEIKKGIDIMLEKNRDSSNTFYQKLSEVGGVFGHSQGGMGAAVASSHPSVGAAVILEGGSAFSTKPTLFLTGPTELMNSFNQAGFSSATGPTFLGGVKGAEHISTGILNEFAGGGQNKEMNRAMSAWFRCVLCGDETACSQFVGTDCGLCHDPMWPQVKQKNLEKL